MYEDIFESKEYYYMGSFEKPIFVCDECNLTMTPADDADIEPCPVCNKLLHRQMVPITFTQDHRYATVSC